MRTDCLYRQIRYKQSRRNRQQVICGHHRACARVRVFKARLWMLSSTHRTPLCRWTSCSLDSCRTPPQTPSARTHHGRPCNRRRMARHASACGFCQISTGTRRGRCLGATISICWPSNAMTSSEERTSAETNSSTLLHREVTDGLLHLPTPNSKGRVRSNPSVPSSRFSLVGRVRQICQTCRPLDCILV